MLQSTILSDRYINDTLIETSMTDGSYSFWISFQPEGGNATNYQIELVYYGSNALNLTAQTTTPNGEEYAVCTTLHYFGYKPTANSTLLTVE